MRKIISKIVGTLLGLSLAVGVGVAVNLKNRATETNAAAYSLVPNQANTGTSSTSYITSLTSFTYNGVSWKMNQWNASTLQIKTNQSSASSEFRFYNTSAFPGKITSVVLSFQSLTLSSTSTTGFMFVGGSSEQSGTSSGTNGTWDSSAKTITWTPASTSNFTYFAFYQNGKVATGTNKLATSNSIVVNYESGPSKLAAPGKPSYNSSTQRLTWSAVENASSYQITTDDGSNWTNVTNSSERYHDVSSWTNNTSYTVALRAVGDGTNYSTSDKGTSETFTKIASPTYTSVTVTGGSLEGGIKGSAYIQCSASAQGTNLPSTISYTWSITSTNSFDSSTSISGKASIDSTGKVTFLDNCTVYVWALAPDGNTHNTTGCSITASGLVAEKGTAENPYTVTEAWNIIDGYADNGNSATVVYVTGVVSGTPTDNSYGSTFVITDGSKSITAYSINGAQSSDSSAAGYVNDGYTVVVGGALIKFYKNSTYTYEVGYKSGFNSSLVSSVAPKSISSIAVKTAPDKLSYASGESFDPTGLVITVTYSDSSNEDVAYADSSASFSFSPATITATGNVTITYGGKTCNQAVTLVTVTNVTGVESAPSQVYKNGSINPADVTLNVVYSDSSVGTVKADSVTCDTSSLGEAEATATFNAATGTKTATFNVNVVNEPVYDYVTDEIVHSDLTATGTSYTDFSGLSKISEAVYKGNTSLQDSTKIGFRSGTTSGQSQHSGIVTTTSGGLISEVSVTNFDHATRVLDVYGSDVPYSDPNDLYGDGKGEKLGSLSIDSQTLTITGNYAYVGIRSYDGLIKVSSVCFTWKVEGASSPLVENPTLSTGAAANIVLGKSLPLTVTTNPVDSDERLEVTSSDTSCVTVSGSGRNYILSAKALGSATITVAGIKGVYSSSVVVTVIAAQKTYEDKVLTADVLGLAANYNDSDGSHSFEDVEYVTSKVCKTNGLQFQKDNGKLYNNEELYSTNNIKSITLVMNANNKNEPVVYQGTSAEPTTSVEPLVDFSTTGVNTYVFSSGNPFFKIGPSSSGAVNIDKVIIELEDSSSSVLGEARLAATAILTDLTGNCGEGGSGVVTQSEWDTLEADLEGIGLSNEAKALLKDAERICLGNLSQGGAEIENAMAHYDACVEKFGFTPDSLLTNVQSSAGARNTEMVTNTNASTIIIVVVALTSITSIGVLLVIKRKRSLVK